MLHQCNDRLWFWFRSVVDCSFAGVWPCTSSFSTEYRVWLKEKRGGGGRVAIHLKNHDGWKYAKRQEQLLSSVQKLRLSSLTKVNIYLPHLLSSCLAGHLRKWKLYGIICFDSLHPIFSFSKIRHILSKLVLREEKSKVTGVPLLYNKLNDCFGLPVFLGTWNTKAMCLCLEAEWSKNTTDSDNSGGP